MSSTELHSIVVPMFNESPVAEEFIKRATAALASLPDYEIIVIDDGSKDDTFAIVSALADHDPHLKIVRFARNFGHQTATTAGIDLAGGDTVTVIDADLQDPPELIPKMIELWRGGTDIVFAVRESRAGESAFKTATAAAYYRLLRRTAQVDIPLDTADFRLMSRKATEGLKAMRERSRYMRGLVGWMGLNRASITYHRDPRFAGETKYPLRKMAKLDHKKTPCISCERRQTAIPPTIIWSAQIRPQSDAIWQALSCNCCMGYVIGKTLFSHRSPILVTRLAKMRPPSSNQWLHGAQFVFIVFVGVCGQAPHHNGAEVVMLRRHAFAHGVDNTFTPNVHCRTGRVKVAKNGIFDQFPNPVTTKQYTVAGMQFDRRVSQVGFDVFFIGAERRVKHVSSRMLPQFFDRIQAGINESLYQAVIV